ncbi:Na+/H+ antiporter NhaD/arsenite permease-like protein [Lactobacillus colini]|uniref:Na+/H+ antiporter NhaD/arsenite permease-like protein n=1 Tax=Lactobacillus colini TaxID=1819254 RepID=A0ABS4MCS2_9LACO|nr:SLC13 family permease [Lactobacillus colini]MBP2057486.1 Na+/H+ antiporter NhaD/arsenite permease-like protein [Lactobacillus colini]
MTVFKHIIKDRILQITVIITIISLFFARPRIADINFHTLFSVLAMLTIIQIFAYLHVLDVIAYKLTTHAKNTRRLAATFTFLSVIAGMFLTNDITVLTLIPLYLTIAKKHKLPEILPVTLIGMGANVGAAFTPWGNPHNIFVVNQYNVSPLKFFSWSLPLLVVSIFILLLFLAFVKPVDIPSVPQQDIRISMRPTILTAAVFFFFFFGVFNVVPAYVPAIVAVILALIINPSIMLHVDYALLLTFTCFFIFISDIQQIPLIVGLISKAMFSEHSVFLTSIISSQFISNVPSTILIGRFTKYAEALFLGSNIGGFGSIVGSMANMLVFKSFVEHGSVSKSRFFWVFTVLEYIGLIILMGLGWLVLDFVL